MINKHDAVMEYMFQCPEIKDIFFAFGELKNTDTQIVPVQGSETVKIYVDGEKQKYYTLAIIAVKPIATIPNSKENSLSMFDSEKIMEWIEQQEKAKNYPNFGDKCTIVKIENLNDMPQIAAQTDKEMKLMFQIRIVYDERS